MSLQASALPFATPYDAADDAASSVDPLGTVPGAERLADALLPGLTARMWRPRLLTFSTLAAFLADEATAARGDRDDERREARLVFERMYVLAVARAERKDPEAVKPARRRLPGIGRAREALARDEPLTAANFLKGQVINGPIGVMARLSRALGLVSEDMACLNDGRSLLEAWARDEGLESILAHPRRGEGGAWLDRASGCIDKWITRRAWPGPQATLWSALTDNLRSDNIGKAERRELMVRMRADPMRSRTLQLLVESVARYREASAETTDRGAIERTVLCDGVLPLLAEGPIDERLRAAIAAIEAYENGARLAQEAFDTLLWTLTRRHGTTPRASLLGDGELGKAFVRIRGELTLALPVLLHAIHGLRAVPAAALESLAAPLDRLRDDLLGATGDNAHLLDAILARHRRVQEAKRKSPWLDDADAITLMPGFGLDAAEAPCLDKASYLHPFRIVNAVSMLRDLGQVNAGGDHGED